MKMHRMLLGPALALAATAALSTASANAPLVDSNSLYGPGEVAVVDNVSVTNYLAPFTLDRKFAANVDHLIAISARSLEVPPPDLSAAWTLAALGDTDPRTTTWSPEVLPPGDTWVSRVREIVRLTSGDRS